MSENVRYVYRRNHLRFPCEQNIYTKTVGWLLPTILGEIFTELGFKAKVNEQQTNGVDLEVFLGDNLILVAEILNWSIRSRLTDKRKGWIIGNLNKFHCKRLLIHTVPLSNLDGVRESGIDILAIGYQILPETYYDFFLARGQVIRRKIECYSTRRDIRSKILDYVNNRLFAHRYLKFLFIGS